MNYFSTPQTLKDLADNAYRLSWSVKNNYDNCPRSWFANNYCRTGIQQVLFQENTYSLPGWTIQKLFETFINGRVYQRPEMSSLDALNKWFDTNIVALTETVAMPYQAQNDISNTRTFFQTKEGKTLAQAKMLKDHLDSSIKGLQPHFLDETTFMAVNKSWDSYYKKLSRICSRVLDMWVRDSVVLDKMLCESFIHMYLGKFHIVGRTDFIYSPASASPLLDLNQLQGGWALIDGKYHSNSPHVHSEQLQLYNTLIHEMVGKVSSYIMFLDYSDCKYKTFQPDLNYKYFLSDFCNTLNDQIVRLVEWLSDPAHSQEEMFAIEEAPVPATPSEAGCAFCKLKETCHEYQMAQSSIKTLDMLTLKKKKAEIMEQFKGKDPSTPQTITL